MTPVFSKCYVPAAVVDWLVQAIYVHGGSQIFLLCFLVCAIAILELHDALVSPAAGGGLAVSAVFSYACTIYLIYAAIFVAYPTYVRKVYVEVYFALRSDSTWTPRGGEGAQLGPGPHPPHTEQPGRAPTQTPALTLTLTLTLGPARVARVRLAPTHGRDGPAVPRCLGRVGHLLRR